MFTVPNYQQLQNRMVGFSSPGRTAAMYPVRDTSLARVVLLWRTPVLHDYARHDLDAMAREWMDDVHVLSSTSAQTAGNGAPRSRSRSGSTWRTACGFRASSGR